MKIARLELRAYGPFTDATLDFADGAPALYLVHGRNEAGKSTTLRALIGLLFGIDRQTPDDHVHPYKDLRIGAVLVGGDGRELRVVRRKADKNDLLDMDGEQPMEPAALRHLLGGVDEELFRAMYGLDQEALRRGGAALLRGEGELGASLLDAGLGGRGIHDVIKGLEREAEELYVVRGKRRLNEAIREYRDAAKAVRKDEVSAEAWQTQREAIDRAKAELEELDGRRRELSEEKHRLGRVLAVLAPIARWQSKQAERATLGEVKPIADEDIDRRRKAEVERDDCARETKRIEAELADLRERRAALEVPEGLLEVPDDVVEDVRDRLGSYRKAQADRPGLEARLHQVEEDAAAILARLGRDVPVGEAESLRVRSGIAKRVRELAQERSGLEAALGHAARAVDEADERLTLVTARLTSAVGVSSLPPPGTIPAPDEETVARLAGELDAVEAERVRLSAREEGLAARLGEVDRDLTAEATVGEVPTEEQLSRARAERDDAWEAIRAHGVGEGRGEAFEEAMRSADETADRLRREATRVATHARLVAERAKVEAERAELAERKEGLGGRMQTQLDRWRAAWSVCGFEPLEPVRMRGWLRDLAEARSAAEARRRALGQRAETERAMARWDARWAERMAELGLEPGASAAEAEAVLDALDELFGKLDGAAGFRRRIEGMDRDAEGLAALVGGLCETHAPDLCGLPVDAQGEALVGRHFDGRRDLATRTMLDRDIQTREGRLQDVKRRVAQAGDVLERCMREAGVGDLDALREAEDRARRAREVERELRELEDEILEVGQGATLEELSRQAEGLEAWKVRARLDAIDADLEQLEDQRQQAAHELGRNERGLEQIESRSAADAADDAQAELARVRAFAHRYVRLRLAATLLQREIERYREQHQGPVLGRANELFPRLTLGRYAGVKAGFGANDEPVLVCVRDDGKEVGVEGLSDGTRDQLYLALRVATLEHHARSADPLPVVLDDVLVQFDDERTRAGLEVLGELAASTQVLLFTHHARLVELAREVVPAGRLRVHDLDVVRASSAAQSQPISANHAK